MNSIYRFAFPLLMTAEILCGCAFADTPLTETGARVFLDFSTGGADEIVIGGFISGSITSNGNFAGTRVSASIGALTRNFRLDSDGKDQNPASYFALRVDNGGTRFVFNAQSADLDSLFAPQNLTDTTVTDQPTTMPVSVTFNGTTTYSVSLTGNYTATEGKSGTATYGTFVNTKKGKPVILYQISSRQAEPDSGEYPGRVLG